MKEPATLIETRWHEDGEIITRPAGTECFRVTGDLSEYEDEPGLGSHIETETKKRKTVAILLDGKLRHVWPEMISG